MPVVNDTVKNCVIINGVNTSSAVTVLGNDGTPGYFNSITVQNNDIRRASVGVFSNAALVAGNGSGTTVTQNKIDNTGPNAILMVGVYMQGVDGGTISNNVVGNFVNTDNNEDTGIWLASGTVNTTVSGNTVSSLGADPAANSDTITYGIRETSSVGASGNVISTNSVSNMNHWALNQVIGIAVAGGGVLVERNNVQGIANVHTGTYGAYGIDIEVLNNCIVRNNFVSNITQNMTTGNAFTDTYGVFGIRIAQGTGHKIYNNSVNLYGTLPGTANSRLLSAALAVNSTYSTGLDIRNNIFSNTLNGGTTLVAQVSVYLPGGATSGLGLTSNRNSYYYGTDAARQGIGLNSPFAGPPTLLDLAALAAHTSMLGNVTNDNASTESTGAVPFASANDLHITNTATEYNTGATIASVTNDFDNDTRPQFGSYDKGADEVSGVATATPTVTPTATPTNTPTATPTNTPTATATSTSTATATSTPTATPTSTPAGGTCSGTRNIPGDYADLAAAITDINTFGISPGGGGCTLNLVTGNPQTAPTGGYTISVIANPPSVADPLIITGNANTITASSALTAGNLNDAIFKIIGSDFVTIQGFAMSENPANTTTAAASNNMTEWGVALLYASTTDNALNCTIRNNTIDLDRTYQNTFGIYANATHTATSVTTSASATGAGGGTAGIAAGEFTLASATPAMSVGKPPCRTTVSVGTFTPPKSLKSR
jgi:hypothetical protein